MSTKGAAAANGTKATTVPLLINGKEVVTSTTFDVTSPSSSEQLWRCSTASTAEAERAISAAQSAFPAWSSTKPSDRRSIFLRAADILDRRADELAEYMQKETGAQEQFTQFNLKNSAEMIRDVAGRIAGALSGSVPVCEGMGTGALVLREPWGVVLGVAPWNAPYILGFRSFIYALAVGNTCVVKGSELSPRCFWALGSIFQDAGLPSGCLNVLYVRPEEAAEVTKALIEHPAVKKVNFTGSTAVGRIIAETAGRALKPVLLELGGKASAVVCEDADLEVAARECAVGSFLHAGQICMATERILVHRNVVGAFQEKLKEWIERVFGGGEAMVLISKVGVEKNRKLVADARAKGATIVAGDPDVEEESKHRMRPIVIGDVTKEMEIYHTESFGPSVSLIPVDSDDEAIEIANDTDYGLSGAVFTENLRRGLRIARRIESGAVHINSMSVHDEAGLPHGGAKKSGWGRFNAEWGMEEFLRIKTITFQE